MSNSPSPARRMQGVQAPIIPEVAQLIAEHPGTISLGQGMVAFPPPPSARAALEGRWQAPTSHLYGPVRGEDELLAALRHKLEADNGLVVDADRWLFVAAGSNMAFLQVILAVTDPDDEVILLSPFYFNHQMAIGIAGCRTIDVPTDGNYQPDMAAIEAAMGPRTRAVVTVSPNNPTGAVYGREVLQRINHLCRDRGVYHVHDEAYEYFLWDDARHMSPCALEGAADHTVGLYSFSKAYGMAGWRVGYGVVPSHLHGAMLKIQDTNLICPPRWSQWAALGALDAGVDYCRHHLRPLVDVRRRLLDGLLSLGDRLQRRPLERGATAQGAMYAWIEVSASGQQDRPWTGRQLNEALIRRYRVAALPGETFGVSDKAALRISFGALAAERAEEGVSRLLRGLRELLA